MDVLPVIAAAVLLGNVVKGVTGFGSALVAIPLVSFVLPPAEAMAAVVTADVVGGAVLLWAARRDVPWRLAAGGIATMIPGQWLGTSLQAALPMDLVRRVLGATVILMAALLLRQATRPPRRDLVATPARAALICAGAGVMGGLVGTPGPLMVTWSQRALDPAVARAWLLAVFAPGALAFVAMLVGKGLVPPSLPALAATAVPAALLGSWIGTQLAPRLDSVRFAWLAAGALALSGAALVATTPHDVAAVGAQR